MASMDRTWSKALGLSSEGVPNAKNGGKSVIQQKMMWCHEHLGKDTNIITCSSSEKYKCGGPTCIFIDNLLLHKSKWAAAD
eukprot:347398-Ditylum_brightwellii.AAC.1